MKIPVSVTILTKNSQRYLREVLTALEIFDEIVVYDTGSQDRTQDIASQFSNVCLHQGPFIGFGPTHNQATDRASHDWILSIDSDEVMTPTLANEIRSLTLMRGCVYSFPRHNEYRGKWIRWCGWHPDRQIRLYHRLDTRFTEAQVHESIELRNLKQINLYSPLRHYSYENASEFLQKMEHYSSLFALQNQGKKHASLSKAVLHAGYAFFKSYFLKRGILGKREGFEISYYNANTAFYKYLKLAEANERLKKEQEKTNS